VRAAIAVPQIAKPLASSNETRAMRRFMSFLRVGLFSKASRAGFGGGRTLPLLREGEAETDNQPSRVLMRFADARTYLP
jgi:hypothetical protein